ncbi:ATP-dependent helicase [Streptomyces californicus]|uniref:ATP-dependent helicase n=1 Tax=Streptomyces californicus TaxID=67351 RepID=UPI0007C51B05|nr:ATP-dependent DNA helicase [Streptomyces californicus]QRV55471.1 ATP-dependent helicase [Streptomyces californicus]
MEIEKSLRNWLTPEQYAAAVAPEREVLALAGAGSGKSRALAGRVAHRVASGAPPESIVAFTFTEKAGEQIKTRVASALQECGLDPLLVGGMYIGTIHAWCRRVLGDMDARYRQFDVLDEMQFRVYLISRYPKLGVHALRDARPTAKGDRRGYFESLKQLSRAWQMMNDELLDPDQVAAEDPELGAALERLRFNMEKDNFIDFSLMQRLVVEALESGDTGAVEALAPLRHVLVDEYQDVNVVQERLIALMHQHSETLFVVGDDDQAIYGFRGADVTNILEFDKRYPNASVHKLLTNFRSTSAIVEAAGDFIAQEVGAMRLPKVLRAHTNRSPRECVVQQFPDRQAEAAFVADRIKSLLGTEYEESDGTRRGLTPADFAILMRSTNTEEQDKTKRHTAFVDALDALDIVYDLDAGGQLFDRAQPAALRNAFELMRNSTPDRSQVDHLFHSELVPAFKLADLNRVRRVFADWGRRIHMPLAPGVPRQRLFPQQLLHDLLEALNVAESGFDDGVMTDLGTFSRIMQDVESVYVSIDTKLRFGELLNFLNNVAGTGYDTDRQMMTRPDAVSVSTVHKAKGLEFPVVFVVDVEANRFPGRRYNYDGWIPSTLIQQALDNGSYQTGTAGEARLFYTAITRAERYLYVTGSAQLPGGKRTARVSPFAARLTHAEVRRDLLEAGAPPLVTPPSAPPRRRGDESVLPTTYSQIHTFMRCPHAYKLSVVNGFSPPVPELFGFGRAVHAAVGKLHQTYRNSSAPTPEEARSIAEELFHLKHISPSSDPVNRPGAYEQAKQKSSDIVADYAKHYAEDFETTRQVELPFEIPVTGGVISGAIDLLLRFDDADKIRDAKVIDFKAMKGGPDPVNNPDLHWEDLSLQVQLYGRGAELVHGANARTGAVHLLKDSKRIDVPVDQEAVDDAVSNVEWAVKRITEGDFPQRASATKCKSCDFAQLCAQNVEIFATNEMPPPLHLPDGRGGKTFRHIAALSQTGPGC